MSFSWKAISRARAVATRPPTVQNSDPTHPFHDMVGTFCGVCATALKLGSGVFCVCCGFCGL